MKNINSLSICLIAVMFLLSSAVYAGVPKLVSFQGVLTDDLGMTLDTTVSMTFSIYDNQGGGTALWSEFQPNVSVKAGIFSVLLGSVEPLEDFVFAEGSRWLGITVGTESEMSPLTEFVTVPFSYRVNSVDGASGGIITGELAVTDKLTVGPYNINGGKDSFVGGTRNTSSNDYVTIPGGHYNEGQGICNTISGGYSNVAAGDYVAIGGGMGNSASGMFAFIPGGSRNIADGDYSFVLGNMGIAGHTGSIVISANDCGT